MGAKRNAYGIFVGKPEVKRPLGRPTCRWVDNIKMDLRETGSIWLRIGPVEGSCEPGNESSSSRKCWGSS
jgi:hypothetical protein